MKRVILFIVCMIVFCVPMLSTEAEEVLPLSVEVHMDGSFVVKTNLKSSSWRGLCEDNLVCLYTKETWEESKSDIMFDKALIQWYPEDGKDKSYYYPDTGCYIMSPDDPAFLDLEWNEWGWLYSPLRAGKYYVQLTSYDINSNFLRTEPIEFEIPEFDSLPPVGPLTPTPTPPPPPLAIEVHSNGSFTATTNLTEIDQPDLENIRVCVYTKESFEKYEQDGTPMEYIMWWSANFSEERKCPYPESEALIPNQNHSAFIDVNSWQLRAGTYYVDVSGYAMEAVDGKNEKVLKYVVEPISFEIPDTGFTPRPTAPQTPAVTSTPVASLTTAPVSTAAVIPAGQGTDYLLWIFIGAAVLVPAGVITATVLIKKRK